MADSVARLGIEVDATGAIREVKQFGDAAGASAKKATLLESTAGKLKAAMGGLAVAAVAGIFYKTIQETIAAQAAMAQLEAVVKSTGGAAGFTAQQLAEQASALQKLTTYGDDAVISAQALLLTFTRIRGPEFEGATMAVLNMATAMGTDLKSASIQVGKALNDPIAGVNALARSGVQFSDSQKDVIKNLVETGRQAEAQRIILKELDTQFGGSAAAARNTLGGALQGLKNDWGDLFEVSKGGSQGMVDAINAIAKVIQSVGPAIDTFMKNTVAGWRILSMDLTKGDFMKRRQEILDAVNAPAAAATAAGTGTGGAGGGAGGVDEAVEAYKRLRQSMRDAAQGYLEESRDLNRTAIERAYAANALEHERRVRDINTDKSLKPYREELIRESLALRESADAQASRTEQVRRATEAQDAKAEAIRRALENAKAAEKQALDEAAAQALELRRMLTQTMSDGFKSIFTDGLSGFRQFFDSVRSMFINFAADLAAQKIMDKIMGTSSTMTRGQGLMASAGAGFAIGGATQNGFGGALGGAATGFAVAGPLGALAGGLSGLVGGLMGAAKATEAHRRALDDLQKSLAMLEAESAGNSVEVQRLQITAQFDALRRAWMDAHNTWGRTTKEYQDYLDRLDVEERRRIENIQKETEALTALNRSMLNLAPGFKMAAAIFGAIDPRESIPGTGGSGRPRTPAGEPQTLIIPVTLDGQVITRVVVDNLSARADAQGRDHWSGAEYH